LVQSRCLLSVIVIALIASSASRRFTQRWPRASAQDGGDTLPLWLDCRRRPVDEQEALGLFLVFDDRPSDSPFIERVWRCRSERAGRFLSVASSHWEMVVTRYRGETTLTVRGPETKATVIDCPPEGAWLGIRFRFGTFMPQLPVPKLLDGSDVNLPGASDRSFWLNGSAWEFPSFENAEAFVARLVRERLIVRDFAVEAALRSERPALSLRSAQRHFLQATGMTHSTYRQIERARYATNLLRQGVPILDAVHEAGFFDQAHLTRSLKHLIGQTPAKIMRREEQLSFLYKTSPLDRVTI
jgi:AraC-like DNA-binding protein